jgi:hypothetical protein
MNGMILGPSVTRANPELGGLTKTWLCTSCSLAIIPQRNKSPTSFTQYRGKRCTSFSIYGDDVQFVDRDPRKYWLKMIARAEENRRGGRRCMIVCLRAMVVSRSVEDRWIFRNLWNICQTRHALTSCNIPRIPTTRTLDHPLP